MLKPIIKHYDVHLLAFFVVTDMSCQTLTERERERAGGKAEREGEGNFMEGGKEVRLSLAGRRPVNHHADHVYVQILFTTLTWSCIYYQLRFFFTLLCNLLDILITHSHQARSRVCVFFFTERCHPTMRRTKRGRKAQVSREGGKGEWGGGEGEFYRLS